MSGDIVDRAARLRDRPSLSLIWALSSLSLSLSLFFRKSIEVKMKTEIIFRGQG